MKQLYNSGMVDELEKEALLEPIEKNERRLVRTGTLNLSHRIDEVDRATSLPGILHAKCSDKI